MYKIHEVLIPSKFSVLILQIILTIVVGFTMVENILAGIPATTSTTSLEYMSANTNILAGVVLFYVTQIAEIVILFIGITIFLNFLSLCRIINLTIEIFFHSIGVILLSWYIYKQWTATDIWGIWIISGLIPITLEICGIIYIRLHYRRVLKIN